MRAFWILLVVLLLGAGGVLVARPSGQESRTPGLATDASPPRPAGRPRSPDRRPPPPSPVTPAAATVSTDTPTTPPTSPPGDAAAADDTTDLAAEVTAPATVAAAEEPAVEPAGAEASVADATGTPKIDPVRPPETIAAGEPPTPDATATEAVAPESSTPAAPDETRATTAAQLAADLLASAERREQESGTFKPGGTEADVTPPAAPDPAAPPVTAASDQPETPTESKPQEPATTVAVADATVANEPPPAATPPADTVATSEPATVAPAGPDDESDEGESDAEATALVRQDDGSWLVDDRFVLRGTGSDGDPYRVSWEHIIAAAETYKPRKGMTEIPEWIQMLDGTQVKLTGYLAFPLASKTVDEALIMLNQWDGCCIGVPPSPYDGVEVRLSSPIELKEGHFFRFGNVTGTFKVDPYLVNDWLVGLYLIEGAKLEAGM